MKLKLRWFRYFFLLFHNLPLHVTLSEGSLKQALTILRSSFTVSKSAVRIAHLELSHLLSSNKGKVDTSLYVPEKFVHFFFFFFF